MRRPKKHAQRPNAVVYVRVSSEEQVHNLSLDTQQQRTVAYCTRNNWPVVGVFRDEGKSAKTIQREEFQKMLRFCSDRANGVGYVVVNDLSRFSRNTADSLATSAYFASIGVKLRSVSESLDESPSGTFTATVIHAANQLENDIKAVRTKSGMLEAASIGRFPHKAPLGYRNILGAPKKSTNIEPDPETGPLVVKAFELIATGSYSTADALRKVTQLGLKTAKGKSVSAQTFQKILVNPLYKGVIHLPNGTSQAPAISLRW